MRADITCAANNQKFHVYLLQTGTALVPLQGLPRG